MLIFLGEKIRWYHAIWYKISQINTIKLHVQYVMWCKVFSHCLNLSACNTPTLNFIIVSRAHIHSSHRQVNSRVNTQRSVLGRERPASVLHDDGAPGADVSVDDKLVVKAALGAGVVGLADRQEVGRETSRHHLARVDEDVCGKQAERKHTWDTQMRVYSS